MWFLLLLIGGFLIGYFAAFKTNGVSQDHKDIAEKAINILSSASTTVASLVNGGNQGDIEFTHPGANGHIDRAYISFNIRGQFVRHLTRIVNTSPDLHLDYYFVKIDEYSTVTHVKIEPAVLILDFKETDGSLKKIKTIISPPYTSGEYGTGYLYVTITDLEGITYTTENSTIIDSYEAIEQFKNSKGFRKNIPSYD